MGKYRTQDQIDAWQKQTGYKSMREVMAAEKEAREQGAGSPTARVISAEQAEQMMAQSVGEGGGEGKADKMVRLLESIDRKLDGIGRIG